MSRLIDADELKTRMLEYYEDSWNLHKEIMDFFDNTPTIERETGEWIVMETAYEDTEAKCSECGFTTLVNEPGNGLHMLSDLNYCPNCGAKMKKPMTIPEEIINSVLGYDD